jgi:2',3'-cyclic-nucleotide 2'-phosphodiesterase (5'-nucleotidase family)
MNKLLIFSAVLIISAACSTSFKTVDYKYQNNSINEQTDSVRDENFSAILTPYKIKLGDQLLEIISYSDTSLVVYRPESPLGNFVSDLTLGFANEFASKNQPDIKVDFSLVNNGGLRTSLPKGKITVGHIFELTPFENELVLLKLSGNQVAELANYIASRDGEGVAGISFGIRSGRAEAITVQNKPLDLNASYWMVTNDYLANGGDGMKVLTLAGQRVVTRAKVRDVIISQLRNLKSKGQTVTAKTDGRIYHVE